MQPPVRPASFPSPMARPGLTPPQRRHPALPPQKPRTWRCAASKRWATSPSAAPSRHPAPAAPRAGPGQRPPHPQHTTAHLPRHAPRWATSRIRQRYLQQLLVRKSQYPFKHDDVGPIHRFLWADKSRTRPAPLMHAAAMPTLGTESTSTPTHGRDSP